MTTKSDNGLPIYKDIIFSIADDYIADLDDDSKQRFYSNNKMMFNDLLTEIYEQYFMSNPMDYNDVKQMSQIWRCYARLCYKCGKRLTLQGFVTMTGVDDNTLYDWEKGRTRTYIYYDEQGNRIKNLLAYQKQYPNATVIKKSSREHMDFVKRCLKDCEQSLLDGATEQNSIGCIFALKALYGYSDQPRTQVQQLPSGTPLAMSELPQLTADAPEQTLDAPE